MGGMCDASSEMIQSWMNLRIQSNSSIVDVVSTAGMKLGVALSQPLSDEKDMFVADNYMTPHPDPAAYKITFSCVGYRQSCG